MVVGTHKIIAKLVYKHLLAKLNFKLDWTKFLYGNLQPDMNRDYVDCEHTLEDSLLCINYNAEELMRSDVSIKEFSFALGIICHFICDYFCLYHTINYWKKDSLAHGLYEASLHARILKGNINLQYKCKPEKNLEQMVLKLRKKYDSDEANMDRDINYAIIAALSISEMITSRWLKHKG